MRNGSADTTTASGRARKVAAAPMSSASGSAGSRRSARQQAEQDEQARPRRAAPVDRRSRARPAVRQRGVAEHERREVDAEEAADVQLLPAAKASRHSATVASG
jgi:hypothetical protein